MTREEFAKACAGGDKGMDVMDYLCSHLHTDHDPVHCDYQCPYPEDCACDSCFRGTHRLACEVLRLRVIIKSWAEADHARSQRRIMSSA